MLRYIGTKLRPRFSTQQQAPGFEASKLEPAVENIQLVVRKVDD